MVKTVSLLHINNNKIILHINISMALLSHLHTQKYPLTHLLKNTNYDYKIHCLFIC